MGKPISNSNTKVGLSYDEMFNDDFNFDMDSPDVMVFLHMQKTGTKKINPVTIIANCNTFLRWYCVR